MEFYVKHYYEAIVKVYKSEVYVNSKTNQGVDTILKLMNPLLIKLANQLYLSGYDFDDKLQQLRLLLMSGVRHYDPQRNIKMSTFLQGHLQKKTATLISEHCRKPHLIAFGNGMYEKENPSEKKVKDIGLSIKLQDCDHLQQTKHVFPLDDDMDIQHLLFKNKELLEELLKDKNLQLSPTRKTQLKRMMLKNLKNKEASLTATTY